MGASRIFKQRDEAMVSTDESYWIVTDVSQISVDGLMRKLLHIQNLLLTYFENG